MRLEINAFEMAPSIVLAVAEQLWNEWEENHWDHASDCRNFYESLLKSEEHEDSSRPTVDMVVEVLEALWWVRRGA